MTRAATASSIHGVALLRSFLDFYAALRQILYQTGKKRERCSIYREDFTMSSTQDVVEILEPARNDGRIDFPPVFDSRLSAAAKGVYVTLVGMTARGFIPSQKRLVALCGGKKSQVQRGIDELKEHGYLVVSRARGKDGKLLGYSVWTLYPYANGMFEKESSPSDAEHKRLFINMKSGYTIDYNPRSKPKPNSGNDGGPNQGQNEESQGRALNPTGGMTAPQVLQIPRSEPKPVYGVTAGESASLTKLNLTTETSGIDSKDDLCPVDAIGAVEVGSVIEAGGAIWVSEAKKKFDKLQDLVSFSSGLGLQNLTEEQARSIYDLVAVPSVCTRSWTDDVQFELCKPMIDALAGIVDPKSVWCAVEFYTFGGFGYSPKAKLPSYWFKDNFELVWKQAQCYAANPFGCSEADRTGLFS